MQVETEITRKISKVKLAKNGGLEVSYERVKQDLINDEEVTISGTVTDAGDNFPHPDMTHALELMRVHLAIITGSLDGKKPILEKIDADEDFINLFRVTGFSLGGNGETEGITLVGSKKIKRGILNLVSPFTRFTDENFPYEYSDELSHLAMHAADEANKYLDGKIAPNAQKEISFDDNSDLE